MIIFNNFPIFGRNILGIFFPKQHQKLTNCYKNIKMMYDQTYQHRAKSSVSTKKNVNNKNTINIRGYIGISLFGRTDVWTRVIDK